ncbi:MAG: hypothetical protein LAN83_01135 [Acidobacteriia bacterium]|nr:hypothetical protein [Terriglobia bacterium]
MNYSTLYERHLPVHRTVIVVVLLGALGLAVPSTAQTSIFAIQNSPSPNVQGNTLNAVAALSTSDAWAVGYQNDNNLNDSRTLAMHWDGSQWKLVRTPNPGSHCQGNSGNVLNAVAAVAPNDVWAVGFFFTCNALLKPMVLHWDGTAWTPVHTPALNTNDNAALNGIVALAANDIYVVGYQPASNGAVLTLIEHWDGTAWSVVPSPNPSPTGNLLSAVTASSATDIWAVGNSTDQATVSVQTLALHFDGATWKTVSTPNPLPKQFLDQNVLLSVQSVAANDVTAVGFIADANAQNTLTLIEHWNGTQWSVVPSPNQGEARGDLNTLHGVAAVSGSDLYAAGFYETAATAGQHTTLIEHFDGNTWTIIPSPTRGLAQQLNGIFVLPGTTDVWSVGGASRFGIDFEDGFLQLPKTLVLFSPIG